MAFLGFWDTNFKGSWLCHVYCFLDRRKTPDIPEQTWKTSVAQVSERHQPLLQVEVEMGNLGYMVIFSQQNSVGHGSRTWEKSARVKG